MAEDGRRRRRWLELGFTAAVAAGAAWGGWGAWHDRRLAARFEQVNLGMDRTAAEAVLGRPDWEGACGTYVRTLPREDCARELGYASAFAPIFPSYYMIQLDRGGRVIEAEPVPSP
jgi:hypothetical protein